MPPVRTAKRYIQSTLPWGSRPHAPAEEVSTKPTLHHCVHFGYDKEWEERASRLGHGTRKISFGNGFVLTSQHVEDLLAMGESICEKLWEFEFIYTDVSRAAHNSAKDLTDDAIKLLAQKCPSLRRLTLPGTSALTHEALVALFESCPNLSEVEITSGSRMERNYTDAIFAFLLEREDLAPKLHKLRVDQHPSLCMSSVDMKAMRSVTKQRKKLLVQLIQTTERKYWGDWELESIEYSYQKGRLQSQYFYGPED